MLAIYLVGSRVALADASVDYSPGIYNSTNLLSIGANSGAAAFNGWLDEVRLSDLVRYTGATAQVPSAAFGNDGNTRALWHFDEAACATIFADSSGNTNTLTGQNGAQTGLQGAAAPSLQLSGSTFSADEGAGSAAVTVTRTGDPAPVVGVTVSTASGGTAIAGEDYTETSQRCRWDAARPRRQPASRCLTTQ